MDLDRILRIAEVLRTSGLSRSTIYRLVAVGEFPAPVKLAASAVGWREAEIREWLESRRRAAVPAGAEGER
jgi:prophage regulatory protein